MAKYLRPRRGSKANAAGQKIKLQKGELFMEFPNGYIGKEPGRIVIGDGASSYDSLNYATSATNVFQPFITDPSIYIPRFANTATSTGSGSVNSGMTSIEKMGNGSTASTVTLPTIVSAVKEALVYHGNSITKLNTDLGNKYTKCENVWFHDDMFLLGNYTKNNYTIISSNEGISVSYNNTSYNIEMGYLNNYDGTRTIDIRRTSVQNDSTVGWAHFNTPSLNTALCSIGGIFWTRGWTATSSSANNTALTQDWTLGPGNYIIFVCSPVLSSEGGRPVTINVNHSSYSMFPVYGDIGTRRHLIFHFQTNTNATIYLKTAFSAATTYSNIDQGGLRIVRLG